MIKINLAKKKTASGQPAGKKSSETLFGRFTQKVDTEQLRDFQITKTLLPVIAIGLGWFLLDEYKENEIKRLNILVQNTRIEQAKLKTSLKEVENYEETRKEYDKYDFTIRTKIKTIKKLVTDRKKSPRMLFLLSELIPKDVWLTKFNILGRGSFPLGKIL